MAELLLPLLILDLAEKMIDSCVSREKIPRNI
jgi:hypothetical protein